MVDKRCAKSTYKIHDCGFLYEITEVPLWLPGMNSCSTGLSYFYNKHRCFVCVAPISQLRQKPVSQPLQGRLLYGFSYSRQAGPPAEPTMGHTMWCEGYWPCMQLMCAKKWASAGKAHIVYEENVAVTSKCFLVLLPTEAHLHERTLPFPRINFIELKYFTIACMSPRHEQIGQ